MNTIYVPTRIITGYRSVLFSTEKAAQDWIDRQVSGGDDGDWQVQSETVFSSLDELDRYLGVGAYAPKLTLEQVRRGEFDGRTS